MGRLREQVRRASVYHWAASLIGRAALAGRERLGRVA
jgi:hypothetical protein